MSSAGSSPLPYTLIARSLAKKRYKFLSATGDSEDKTATLSDADQIWTEVRHMHMREAIDKLMADFNKFLEENAGYKSRFVFSVPVSPSVYHMLKVGVCVVEKIDVDIELCSEGATSLNDMKDMLAGLPQYQELREKVMSCSPVSVS